MKIHSSKKRKTLLASASIIPLLYYSPWILSKAHASCVQTGGDVVCSVNTTTGFDDVNGNPVTSITVNNGVTVDGGANSAILVDNNASSIVDTVSIEAGASLTSNGVSSLFSSQVTIDSFVNNGTISGGLNPRNGALNLRDSTFTGETIVQNLGALIGTNGASAGSFEYGAGSIVNLKNDGLIDASSGVGNGLQFENNTGINITNNGTILGGDDGIVSNIANGQSSILTNNGIIAVGNSARTGSGDVALHYAGGGINDGDDSIFNNGVLRSLNAGNGRTTVLFEGGNDIFEIQSGSEIWSDAAHTTAGIVDGGDDTDTLRFGGTTAQSFNLSTIGVDYLNFENFELREGQTSFSGTTGESFTIQDSATLSGTGTFGGLTFQSGATAAPGNSIGTTTVNGDVTFDAGSTYEVEINPNGTSDLISATGTATINGGTVSVLPEAGTYNDATSYTILSAAGSVTGTFDSSTVDHNFAFLTPTLRYDANDVFLDITQTSSFASVAQSNNQNGVATAFDDVFSGAATPGSDNANVMTALAPLTTEQALAAFDSVSGEVHASIQTNVLAQGDFALGTISNRMAYSQGGASFSALGFAAEPDKNNSEKQILSFIGASNSDEAFTKPRNLQGWMRGYGQVGKNEGSNGAADSDTSSYGVLFGLDAELKPDFVAGLAIGYGQTDITVSDRSSSLSSDMFQALGYGSYTKGPWALQGILGYAHHSFDSDRNITIGSLTRNAKADYSGNQFMASAELGYTFQHTDQKTEQVFDIQPIAGVNYGYLRTDGFTETGAGALNLISTGETLTSLNSVLGVKISSQVEQENKTIKPYVQASWSHGFGDLNAQNTLSFEGAGTFTTSGNTTSRDSLNIGGGFTAQINDNTLVFSDYTTKLSNSQTQHTLGGGFKIKF